MLIIWLLTSLASFRLALMFSTESGPGRIFKKAREATKPHSALREGIECILCESVWWSGLFTIYLAYTGLVPLLMAPIFWLACSATACIIHFQWGKD